MIRKVAYVAVAALAVGFMVASPAQAGGGSGAKKSATIKILNNTGNVTGGTIVAAAVPGTVGAAGVANYIANNSKQVTLGNYGVFKLAPGAGSATAAFLADVQYANAVPAIAVPPVPVANAFSAPTGYVGGAGITGFMFVAGGINNTRPNDPANPGAPANFAPPTVFGGRPD